MSYCHLTPDWQNKLQSGLAPLSLDDLLLADELETGDIFTFIGYPWRKTKKRGKTLEGERTTYTGHAAAPDIYSTSGYDRYSHVLIRMRRNKTYSTRYESYQPAPHPQGISGGAVVSWPWTFVDRHDARGMKLAAIGHTYHSSKHCMAATRIIPYLVDIVERNPHLAVHFEQYHIEGDFGSFLADRIGRINTNAVPVAVGIAWYTNETYASCLEIFDDREELPQNFAEWKLIAERAEKQLSAQGMKTVRVVIDPESFPIWCKNNGFETIDNHARMAFGNLKALESVRTVV